MGRYPWLSSADIAISVSFLDQALDIAGLKFLRETPAFIRPRACTQDPPLPSRLVMACCWPCSPLRSPSYTAHETIRLSILIYPEAKIKIKIKKRQRSCEMETMTCTF
ncbi:hypothetical protein B0O99DRAFT_139063 [Bisporella sp. PMI_857]|nr:hypothetical protein B0O99DRAFT_139063 [Bisporella sp. PMI_857]